MWWLCWELFLFSSQFLRDVLDTLFCLLDDNTDKYGPLVFQSLVGNLKRHCNCTYKLNYVLLLSAEGKGITSSYKCVFRCSSLTCSGTAISTTSDLWWTPTSKTTLLELWHTSKTFYSVISRKLDNQNLYAYIVRCDIDSPNFCRELVRCLKWYMDRSAEVVRQDHIQEAMRVKYHTRFPLVQFQSSIVKQVCPGSFSWD